MNDPEAARYILPEDHNRRIFREQITPDQLSSQEPRALPVLVVLMAQHGAGKTTAAASVADVLSRQGGFVDNDSDLFKPYHPEYSALMAEDDQKMALYTGPDGQAWSRQTHAYVLENRLNTLLQETAQSPEFLAEMLERYAAHHRREALALGVPLALSQQGVLNRYYEQVKERGRGRLPVPEKVTRSYQGILATAERIDAAGLAEQTAVFRRGESTPRYQNSRTPDGWTSTPDFPGAIQRERTRPLLAAEERDFLHTQAKLRTSMGPDWHEALTDIEDQALPLLSPDGQQQVEALRSKYAPRAAGQPSPARASAYDSRAEQQEGARQVAQAFSAWSRSPMGERVTGSTNPAIAAFRDAWRTLPPGDLPDGGKQSSGPYQEVARAAARVVRTAAAEGRFSAQDLDLLKTVIDRAQEHAARIVATHGPMAQRTGPTHRTSGQAAPGPPDVAGPKRPGLGL